MFLHFVGHPQGLYLHIWIKRRFLCYTFRTNIDRPYLSMTHKGANYAIVNVLFVKNL